MNHPVLRYSAPVLIAVLAAAPLWAQKGKPAPPPPSQPGQPGRGVPGPINQPSPMPQVRNPQFVYGQIVTEGGQKLPNNTEIKLRCGMAFERAIHPDLNGTFQFNLEGGPQLNPDMSADVAAPGAQMGDSMGTTFSPMGGAQVRLMDCDLRITAAGYQPLNKVVLMQDQDVGGVNVGTLVLTPLTMPADSTISLNTLLAPKKAQKEFKHAQKDIGHGNLKSAERHLKKAVAIYGKFAAAWNDLGRIDLAKHNSSEASQAFSKAIAADPNFIAPYVNLAELQLQASDFQKAADTAQKALAVRPGLAPASFLEAAADLRLNRLDAAEKNARDAERAPHKGIPQVHVLLADIYLHKRDVSSAAGEMRAYLKEAPNGPLASAVKDHLAKIEKLENSASGAAQSAKNTEALPSQPDPKTKP